MTKTDKATAAKPFDLNELRDDLELLKDDIEDVQTLWEQLESHYRKGIHSPSKASAPM